MRFLILFICAFSFSFIYSQEITGTVRGTVIDELSEEPIIGAKVILLNSEPIKGVLTDFEGKFKLTNIPVGRHSVQITYYGYKPIILPNLEVLTKELTFIVKMVDYVRDLGEVSVKANKQEDLVNELVTNSSRSFSIEESQRYAGSLGDVARMAQNFAGVQGADDSRNDIIIRGNSPSGVLYRLEGIDIPNPNHFANFGTTGGPISMINPNMLSKSDFLTGAFPAEYGNANAGVFDLHLRNGNNEKYEFLAQMGFNGFEGMAEGPFSKKSKASFAVNYRYSALQLLSLMGVNFGTSSVPKYQDATFKINIPTKNSLTTIFGLGGISKIDLLAANTVEGEDLYANGGDDTYFSGYTGFVGINHKQRLNSKSFLKLNVAVQAATNRLQNDTLDQNLQNPFTNYMKNGLQGRQTTAIHYTNKINSRHYIKAGVFFDLFFFSLTDSIYRQEYNSFVPIHDTKGNTGLLKPYISYQYKITDNLTLNGGIHYQQLLIDNQNNIEPRLGLAWNVNKKNRLSLAYGYHSQMQPLEIYYQENQIAPGEYILSNNKLEFTKSQHGVIGYDLYLKHGLHFKTEIYGQLIHNAPVQQVSSAYSALNFGAEFYAVIPDSLVNEGTGSNYGIEMTFEKRMDKGLYFMFNGSLFESKYKGSDGIERNSSFNGNFTSNLLAGYEHRFKRKEPLNKKGKAKPMFAIAADVKFVMNGGGRYTPILLNESILAGKEVRDLNKVNEGQFQPYLKLNTRLAIKVIQSKMTQELAMDFQNVTGQKNIFQQKYDEKSQTISTVYQTGFLPLVQYRVIF